MPHTAPADNPTTKSSDLPAAPEVAPRSAHSYSGEGTGRLEESKPDAAATGLRAGQRQLGRAQSAGSPASPAAAGGDSLGDEVRVHSTSVQQADWLLQLAIKQSACCCDPACLLNSLRHQQDAPGSRKMMLAVNVATAVV